MLRWRERFGEKLHQRQEAQDRSPTITWNMDDMEFIFNRRLSPTVFAEEESDDA